MSSSPPTPAVYDSSAFEHLTQDYMMLSKGYKQLAQENAALKAALTSTSNAPPSTSSPPPDFKLHPSQMAIMQSSSAVCASHKGGKCLCPKCCGNGGECKKFDAWQNYTAWMHWG